jgi:small conductance mechanosensitive channel
MTGDFYIFIRPFLNAILLGIAGAVLAFLVAQLLGRLLMRPLGAAWGRFVSNLIGLIILIWFVKIILDSTGAAGLVVVLVTAITGAFAIGSERVAADLIAGVTLFVSKPYKESDFVQLAGHEGQVTGVTMIATTLRSVNGDTIIIRNSEITDNVIINFSTIKGHRISVKIPLPAGQDLDKAIRVVTEAIQGFSPKLDPQEFPASVVFESAAYGYAYMDVYAYTLERLDYGPEKSRLFMLAANALKNAGIKFSN